MNFRSYWTALVMSLVAEGDAAREAAHLEARTDAIVARYAAEELCVDEDAPTLRMIRVAGEL